MRILRYFRKGRLIRETIITLEEAERMRREAEARRVITHPDTAPPVSGCCDSALNPTPPG
jgi:hypothetical protein